MPRRVPAPERTAERLRLAARRYAIHAQGGEADDHNLLEAARDYARAYDADRQSRGMLSERSFELLVHLAAFDLDLWLRPMDLGGTDGSHHSVTLQRLTRRGLVERRRREVPPVADLVELAERRGSWEYRATDAGRALAGAPPSKS